MKLTTKTRIQEILDKGERWQTGPLRWYRLPAESSGRGKLSILIAKKRYALSVDRNRLRRLIRESLRETGKSIGDWDVAVSVNGVSPDMNQADMLQWVRRGVSRA